ncbi:endo alpha-1,4 polygalactosaminidase, partial [uncultured Fretibacterium sp.]|uniref:endo alpha-1,4 polygalactosaminidase n=1 Tax=uncultured Fretibacterium sp. TaxID=1678694 RepID=UPI00261C969A
MGYPTGWAEKIAGWASPCALVAVLVLCGCCLAGEARPERAFDASYGVFIGMRGGEALRDERVLRTRVLVVDPAHFEEREIAFLKVSGHTVYGYLNVGSLEAFRPYYGRFKRFVLGRYENWDGEWWVDVSAAPWRDFVVSELAAEYVRKGIDGFFVDNCDVYHYRRSRRIFDGLSEVLRRLSGYGLEVLINGGDEYATAALEEYGSIAGLFSGVNQETVFTRINFDKLNFETGAFGRSREEDRQYFLSYLEKMEGAGAKIRLLEYTRDADTAREIERFCEARGW